MTRAFFHVAAIIVVITIVVETGGANGRYRIPQPMNIVTKNGGRQYNNLFNNGPRGFNKPQMNLCEDPEILRSIIEALERIVGEVSQMYYPLVVKKVEPGTVKHICDEISKHYWNEMIAMYNSYELSANKKGEVYVGNNMLVNGGHGAVTLIG